MHYLHVCICLVQIKKQVITNSTIARIWEIRRHTLLEFLHRSIEGQSVASSRRIFEFWNLSDLFWTHYSIPLKEICIKQLRCVNLGLGQEWSLIKVCKDGITLPQMGYSMYILFKSPGGIMALPTFGITWSIVFGIRSLDTLMLKGSYCTDGGWLSYLQKILIVT